MSGLKKTKTGETQVSSINGLMRRRADSELASGPYLNPGGPGLETLEEEEEKARFFARLEAGASSTLDYSKLNRELDSTSSTAAASLRCEVISGDCKASDARADSPNYSDHFEDEESEKEPPEKTLQMSSLVSKVSLYDSLESTDGRAPSRQHGVKDPAVSVVSLTYRAAAARWRQSKRAYRQISDAPSDTEERGEGWSSRPSPLASPLEHNRGDHLPASTNGSGRFDPRQETSGAFTLQPTSTSGPGLDLRPGSVERRAGGREAGPLRRPPGGGTGDPPGLRPQTPLCGGGAERQRGGREADGRPGPGPRQPDSLPIHTGPAELSRKPQVLAVGRPSVSSTRKTTSTSRPAGFKGQGGGPLRHRLQVLQSQQACGQGGKSGGESVSSGPPRGSQSLGSCNAARRLRRNAGPRVNDDLIASVQSFAAFLQKQVGATGPAGCHGATWGCQRPQRHGHRSPGACREQCRKHFSMVENVEECSVVEGLAQKERDHLAHKESDLHLRLEEMKMQHREELSALKQENYVLQSKCRGGPAARQPSGWGEAADPMTKERLQLLEKEAQQQETISQGYHQGKREALH
ncbi:Centrosomal protein [Merluccius polli]|uniref:Centrosomal protein of 162 kDa n=1 Tax=Merluccius polli TaxID=89951 RepID=A0AA47P3I6_MERPO|nr:Centrosomal protein [Merluccius polli]